MKKVFTTGQIAKICKVAPQTVSKWFDSGRLRGYRIPGSLDRRIPRENLVRFLKEHGMPLAELEDETANKMLLVGLDTALVFALRERLPETDGFKIEVADNGFEAGIVVESKHPDCIVIDFQIGQNEAVQICQNLRRKPEYQNTILIGLGANIGFGDHAMEALDEILKETFWKPFDVASLAERIRRMIAERKAAAA